MRHPIARLLGHLPTTSPFRLDRTLRVSGVKQAQFVSYMESSGYRTASAFAAAWVVLESAKALIIY